MGLWMLIHTQSMSESTKSAALVMSMCVILGQYLANLADLSSDDFLLELPFSTENPIPIGSMYGIYANIWGILMVNVTIYGIHGSYGIDFLFVRCFFSLKEHAH